MKIFFRSFIVCLYVLTPLFASAAQTSPDFESYKEHLSAAIQLAIASTTDISKNQTQDLSPTINLTSISNRDLITLTRPTIVRIITHHIGTSSIPTFDVNLTTRKWSVNSSKTTPVPYDLYMSGSGFIAHPDGYIITNSHVVSDETARLSAASGLVSKILLYKILSLSDSQYSALKASGFDSAQMQQLTTEGLTFVRKNIIMPTKPVVTVLRPSPVSEATTTSALTSQMKAASVAEQKKQILALISEGIQATTVFENKSFLDDEKDAALLKINQKNLPALRLGNSNSVSSGSSIFVFGFPANADFDNLSSEPTFTGGTVSALKPSTQHTFNYIQTDAKISSGSSGGPMFDASGVAVGLLTLGGQQTTGDIFGLAVPINVAQDSIGVALPSSPTYDYANFFLQGLALQKEKHCKAAIEEFNLAASTNTIFGGTEKYIQPYIDECNKLIQSGQSLDSWLEEVVAYVRNMSLLVWGGIVAGTSIVIIFAIAAILLIKRMRKEENMIRTLEHEIADTHHVADTEAIHPELVQYIKTSRAANQTDAQIKTALVASGWNTSEVDRALLSK